MFTVSPAIDTKALEQLFRYKVLRMLLAKGKITTHVIALMDKWCHTGFNVFCGSRILPWQKISMASGSTSSPSGNHRESFTQKYL